MATSTSAACSVVKMTDSKYKVPLSRSLDLFGAVAMIIGCIVGSGIFISPKGVIQYTGSVGKNAC